MAFGVKFSGFIAWWMWRSIYLAKLPRLAKKLRVMMDWAIAVNLTQGAERFSGALAELLRGRAKFSFSRNDSNRGVLWFRR